jgi:hypothetical protein
MIGRRTLLSSLWASALGAVQRKGPKSKGTLTLTCPMPVTATSTDGFPVPVTYPTPSVSGGVPPVQVVTVPASGSEFPVGTTYVDATARDRLETTVNCSFPITVLHDPPAPPVEPPPGSLSLLTAADLTFQGMWRFADGDPGAHWAEGPMAIRYVGGQRRWLLRASVIGGSGHEIREYTAPATYGATRDTAPEMTFVRGWSSVFNITENFDPNGWVVGGIWWDEAQQVLWYTVYPFYDPGVFRFLGATRLNDNGTTTKFGMWHYISSASQSYKQVCKWILPIPASAQAAAGGRTMAIGADVMSVGANANWGPGLIAMTLPALASTSAVPIGTNLMAYNSTLAATPEEYYCKREPDYSEYIESDSIVAPSGGQGYWALSMDAVGAYVWVETPTKHGIVVLGRRASGRLWYGSPDPDGDGDPFDSLQSESGFHAEFWGASGWVFDPEDLKQVAQGQMQPYDVEFQSRFNWKALWPNIPDDPGNPPGPVFHAPAGAVHGGAYDPLTQQIFWMLPLTYKPGFTRNPTIQVWSVS